MTIAGGLGSYRVHWLLCTLIGLVVRDVHVEYKSTAHGGRRRNTRVSVELMATDSANRWYVMCSETEEDLWQLILYSEIV